MRDEYQQHRDLKQPEPEKVPDWRLETDEEVKLRLEGYKK